MNSNFEIHPIQGKILKVLLFQTSAKFSELNPDKIGSDHFNFHLKALLEANLLEKKSSQYSLTPKGKEFANRFDTEKIVIEKQAKLAVSVVGIKIKSKKKFYLIQQRLKQPYYGYHGTITGKIRWGEKIFAAAKREFYEETGLTATRMTLVGLKHKLDYSPDSKLLEDKFFFRIRVDKFSGKLKPEIEGGKNFWLTHDEILKIDKIFPDMPDVIKAVNSNDLKFIERDYIAEGY